MVRSPGDTSATATVVSSWGAPPTGDGQAGPEGLPSPLSSPPTHPDTTWYRSVALRTAPGLWGDSHLSNEFSPWVGGPDSPGSVTESKHLQGGGPCTASYVRFCNTGPQPLRAWIRKVFGRPSHAAEWPEGGRACERQSSGPEAVRSHSTRGAAFHRLGTVWSPSLRGSGMRDASRASAWP